MLYFCIVKWADVIIGVIVLAAMFIYSGSSYPLDVTLLAVCYAIIITRELNVGVLIGVLSSIFIIAITVAISVAVELLRTGIEGFSCMSALYISNRALYVILICLFLMSIFFNQKKAI